MPPPSSGGVHLLQIVRLLDDGVADNALHVAGWHDDAALHRLIESMRIAYADRAVWLGDPAFVEVPVARLMAPDYLDRRAAEVSPERPSATPAVRPGLAERPQTTHFSILDAQGNAVALTYTFVSRRREIHQGS
jgi:gamma-glutamyltranspeptidase/glutathione hydrolase